MTEVTVEPGGHVLDVEADESLAESAWRQGYRWPTTCWGKAECLVCAVFVLEGENAAADPDDEELEALEGMSPHLRRPNSRLACRLRVLRRGLVVEKKGVRPPQP